MSEEYFTKTIALLKTLAETHLGSDFFYHIYRNDAFQYVLLQVTFRPPHELAGVFSMIFVMVRFDADKWNVAIPVDWGEIHKFSAQSMDELQAGLESRMPSFRLFLDAIIADCEESGDC